jgi:hypothetical protein
MAEDLMALIRSVCWQAGGVAHTEGAGVVRISAHLKIARVGFKASLDQSASLPQSRLSRRANAKFL